MNDSTIDLHEFASEQTGILLESLKEDTMHLAGQVHRHNYWEIYIFKEGSGTHLIDFESVPFKAGSVHIVMPYQVHRLSRSADANGYILKVSDDFFHASPENSELILQLGNYQLHHKAPILNFSSDEFKSIWEIIVRMQIESMIQEPEKTIIMRNYLSIFLCKCRKRLALNSVVMNSRSDLELSISFRHSVEKYFQKHTKIQDYLKLLGVNDKKLFSVCSQYTGVSPSDYLHKRILVEAKRLLLFSTFRQKEIAYRLNFTDLSHFIKFFKQKTGLLPSEYASGFLNPVRKAEEAAV